MTEEYVIEKDVPVPERRGVNHSKYPCYKLEVGDSFVFPESDKGRVRAAVTYCKRKQGKMFAIRTLVNECRCWRLS